MEASALHAPARLARLTASPSLLRLRSDEQLVSLLRAGSKDAFGTIHERYRQRLFAYVRQMLGPGSRQDAEDVLQDVFARAYTALRGDNREVNLRPWLYRVAHNRCIDHLRRPAPAPAELIESTETAIKPLHDPFEDVQRREDLQRLVADIGRLPTQQKSALLLREINGLSYNELAEALDVTVPAIKSLLVRARVELVETAEARDVACASIREELVLTCDTGGRTAPRTRRHLRDCAGCAEYQASLRGMRKSFAALSPVAIFGPLALLGKLSGFGGAGGGTAGAGSGSAGAASTAAAGAAGTAGSAGAATMGGAAGVGLGAVTAGKIAAVVSTAAITAGGAVALERSVSDRPATTPVAAATTTPAGGAAQPTAPGATPSQTFGAPATLGGARDPSAVPGTGGAGAVSPTSPASRTDETGAKRDSGALQPVSSSSPALPTGPALGSPLPVLATPVAPVDEASPERSSGPSAPDDRRVAPPAAGSPTEGRRPRPSPAPDSVRAPERPAVQNPRGGPVADVPAVRPERPNGRPDKPDKPGKAPDSDKRPPVAVTPPSAPEAQTPKVPGAQVPLRKPDRPDKPVKPDKPLNPPQERVNGLVETPKPVTTPPSRVNPVMTPPGQVDKLKTPPGQVDKVTPPGQVDKVKPVKTPPGLVNRVQPEG